MEYRWGITTSHKAGEDLTAKARALAGFWQTEYYPDRAKPLGS